MLSYLSELRNGGDWNVTYVFLFNSQFILESFKISFSKKCHHPHSFHGGFLCFFLLFSCSFFYWVTIQRCDENRPLRSINWPCISNWVGICRQKNASFDYWMKCLCTDGNTEKAIFTFTIHSFVRVHIHTYILSIYS
jgi:hypothetical protein